MPDESKSTTHRSSGCGKTTLVKRVGNKLALPAGGFYTEEIRERGARVGFKLITLDGKEAVFAHINFPAAAGRSDRGARQRKLNLRYHCLAIDFTRRFV